MKITNLTYILFLLSLLVSQTGFGQTDTTITQEVEVIKAYKPTISDANKINDMPVIRESEHQKPVFNYSIFSQPVFNSFLVNPIKAAATAPKPKEEPGFGLMRAGLGNYNKPYGELFFNSQYSKNTVFGIHARHLSSHGKLRLDGGDRVKAPFAENDAEMFIKYMARKSVLSVNLDFKRNGFNYYGYPNDSIPSFLKEEDQNVTYQGKHQAFTQGGLQIQMKNYATGKSEAGYDFDFRYHYFGTKTGQKEHFGEFMSDVRKPLDFATGLLKAGVTYSRAENIFNTNLNANGIRQNTWLTVQPGILLGGDVANIKIGFKAWFVMDKDTNAVGKLAPDIRVNFVPAKEVISIFAGLDGNYHHNHYSAIAWENPFSDPEHDIRNHMEKFRFYGGFDGKFAPGTNFKISAEYAMNKNKPSYYLYQYIYPWSGSIAAPDPSIIENDFKVLYDDLDILGFNLEIFHHSSEKLNLLFSGNYYVYNPGEQTEAWNLPDWDGKISLGYTLTERLKVDANVLVTGTRKALILETTEPVMAQGDYEYISGLTHALHKSYTLNPVFDMNLGANYSITQRFTVFAMLHNFGFQKYQKWFGYPVQSFNFLGGISYSF